MAGRSQVKKHGHPAPVAHISSVVLTPFRCSVAGLGWLLTGVESFDELLDLAGRGDNTAVDLTVGDIYGGAVLAHENSVVLFGRNFAVQAPIPTWGFRLI